jgi:hypothetical protein
MNTKNFIQGIGEALLTAVLVGCTVSVVTPTPPMPVQPQGPVQQFPQPGQPQGPAQQFPQPQQLQQGQQQAMPAPSGNNGNAPSPSRTVLVEQMVTIPGGGGNAEVSFTASSGQRIQILLTASNTSMQPYGNLQYPDGTSQYNPSINTAVNGANKTEASLNQSGQFSLNLFDGSNQGGSVSVKVVLLR